MKKKILLIMLSILAAWIIGIIFMNSAMVREESSVQSGKVLSIVLRILMPYEDVSKINLIYYVRKTAHIVEYACLGIVLAFISRIFESETKRKYICFPLLIGLSVGVIDEYIQSFNDRSSEVQDVIIDFGGIFLGVAIVMIIFLIKDLKKKS